MSLDGIMGGLQITGIGFQQYDNGDAIIGCVIPQDVSVATKYSNLFDAYLNVKYKQLHTILGKLKEKGYQINECTLSERVTIFDGIPAYGVWECWELKAPYASGIVGNLSPIGIIADDYNLIPTKF